MALREKLHARRPDGQLICPRAEQVAFDADDVAEVEQPKELEIMLRERVLLDVHLNPESAVGQHKEIRLAEIPDPEDAAARRRVDAVGFEFGTCRVAMGADEIGNGGRAIESMRIGI